MKKTPFFTLLLLSAFIQKNEAQCSNAGNSPYSAAYYLGYSTGNNLPFATGGLPAQMTLTTNGDLNVNGTTKGYQIGGSYVLLYKGNTSNIYVGVGAGSNALTGSNNTATGYDALYNNASDANTAYGYQALYSNTGGGGENTAVGAQALYLNTKAQANTALGWKALYSNSDSNAIYNTATGYNALFGNTTGSNNTATGAGAMSDNISGSFNAAVGGSALAYNTTGNYNSALGGYALYQSTTGSNNVAMGYQSLTLNNGGNNNTAIGTNSLLYNTTDNNNALGVDALMRNTTGTLNIAVGEAALYNNGTINGSTAIGDSALYSQNATASFNSGNVAIGNSALYANQAFNILGGTAKGIFNTATGEWTLRHNTSGSENTANGYIALYNNTTGTNNTANGAYTLYTNIAGSDNTAFGAYAGTINMGNYNTYIGDSAGYQNITGYYNTYVGYLAGTINGSPSFHNDTYIGYQAGDGISGANNTVYIGNGSIQTIYASAAVSGFTSYSDRRIKNTIRENVAGLAFISKLRPVTYHIDLHKEYELMNSKDTKEWGGQYNIEKITESGFIAQQVDSAAQACGYDFNGIKKPDTPGGLYALNYTAFVVPLVKAVQELNAKNDTLHDSLRRMGSTIDSLRTAFKNIQTCLNQICAATGNGSSGSSEAGVSASEQNVTLSSTDAPLLYQNMPNPFSTGTKINYYLPQGTVGAIIVFYDTYGNKIKTVEINQTGNGTLNVTPDNLANGIYSYSLIVNGNVIDTKKMVLQK